MKNLSTKYKDWYELTGGIYEIYQRLLKLDIAGKAYSKEYLEMMDLLKFSIDLEKKKIDALNINYTNRFAIYNLFKSDIDQVSAKFFIDNNDGIQELRIYNQIYDYIQEIEQDAGYASVLDFLAKVREDNQEMNYKYAKTFMTEAARHLLRIIDLEARENPEDTHYTNHILNYKYNMLYTNAILEGLFANGDLRKDFYMPLEKIADNVPGMTRDTFLRLSKKNLASNIIAYVYELLSINDDELLIGRNIYSLYRFRILVKCYSTLLEEPDFLDILTEELTKQLIEGGLNRKVCYKMIFDLFDESREYINAKKISRK